MVAHAWSGGPNREQGEQLGAGVGGAAAAALEQESGVKPEVAVTLPVERKRKLVPW